MGNAKMDEYVKASFATMRFIVTVGWSIYPLGYFFGYLMGQVEDSSLNLVYNLADLVNKIAFCLVILNSAKQSTLACMEGALLPKLEVNLFAFCPKSTCGEPIYFFSLFSSPRCSYAARCIALLVT